MNDREHHASTERDGGVTGRSSKQAIGQPDDVAPGRIATAMLDVADPALHQAGLLGELHLRDALLVADQADGSPEGGGIW